MWASDLTSFLCMWISICLSSIFLKRLFFSFLYIIVWHPYWKPPNHKTTVLFLDCQSCSIDLYVHPMPEPQNLGYHFFILSFEIRKGESLQLFSSLPRLFWLFWVPCISLWILGSACQFLQRSQLGFWYGLHWICRSVWRGLSSYLEKEMATHSSVLAWRIPGTGEPGGLPSKGSHRVGHDWSDLAAAVILQY